ncbi:MAG: ABC transporter substrate-binding protein [Gammaproteobacteria bacterium]|nr:ABC transporter substrate-binding protein [Gammaproteobacteria bacterium]
MKRVTMSAVVVLSTVVGATAYAKDITVVNFGGAVNTAMKPAYIDPFQKSSGTKVTIVEYTGEQTQLKAMVDNRKVVWDVVEVESGDVGRGCDEGLYEPLNAAALVNTNDFLPAAIHECGIGAFAWSTVLAYNADNFPTQIPIAWKDFWNTKRFPGKRGMRKGARYNLEFALMADGVPAPDVYRVLETSEGIERAFRKLSELKSHIVWWEAGSQVPQMLTAGEVVMSTAYNGRINAAQRQGKNLRVVFRAGNIYDIDYWVIPRGSPNKASALEFIKYATSIDAQVAYAHEIAYGPTNLNALQRLEGNLLSNLPTAPANMRNAVQHNLKFWTNHGDVLERRFADWLAK